MTVETRYRGWTSCVLAALLSWSLPAAAQIPDEFSNLRVLPKDIGKGELIGIMRGYAGALGVRCIHCHVGDDPNSLEGVDFVSDAKQAKKTARVMMRMTRAINDDLLSQIGKESPREVSCVTCHRRLPQPETLQDVLLTALDEDGVDGVVEKYGALRADYYGQGIYDFSHRPLNVLAETLARQHRDLDGAIRLMKLNVEHNPEAELSFMALGRLYAQKGDEKAARAAFEKALELKPGDPWAKRQLEALTDD